MLNIALQKIFERIKNEHPKFGYIRVSLFFDNNEFTEYEFEYSEVNLLLNEEKRNV